MVVVVAGLSIRAPPSEAGARGGSTGCPDEIPEEARLRLRAASAPARRQLAWEGRILEGVSQVERSVAEEVDELDDEERAWLQERLREYRDLLVYLHDH